MSTKLSSQAMLQDIAACQTAQPGQSTQEIVARALFQAGMMLGAFNADLLLPVIEADLQEAWAETVGGDWRETVNEMSHHLLEHLRDGGWAASDDE